VVFRRTLDRVQGNARLAQASVAEEAAAALDATGKHVSIGGAGVRPRSRLTPPSESARHITRGRVSSPLWLVYQLQFLEFIHSYANAMD